MEKVVRAKFRINEKREISNGNTLHHEIKGSPVTDDEGENAFYAGSTPSGELRLYITNNKAAAQLETGKTYYVDLTPVDEGGIVSKPGVSGVGKVQ